MAKKTKLKVPQIPQDKMKRVWEDTFGKKEVISQKTPFRSIVIAALITNLVVIGLSLALHSLLPPEIPLFYGMPEGEEQLASSWLLGLPALLSLAILLINAGVSSAMENDFIKRTLVLVGIAATFFSTITVIKIFFLVGAV